MFNKAIKTVITLSSFAIVVGLTAPESPQIEQVEPVAKVDNRSPDEDMILEWLAQQSQSQHAQLHDAKYTPSPSTQFETVNLSQRLVLRSPSNTL